MLKFGRVRSIEKMSNDSHESDNVTSYPTNHNQSLKRPRSFLKLKSSEKKLFKREMIWLSRGRDRDCLFIIDIYFYLFIFWQSFLCLERKKNGKMAQEEMPTFKLVLVGDGGVGKVCSLLVIYGSQMWIIARLINLTIHLDYFCQTSLDWWVWKEICCNFGSWSPSTRLPYQQRSNAIQRLGHCWTGEIRRT